VLLEAQDCAPTTNGSKPTLLAPITYNKKGWWLCNNLEAIIRAILYINSLRLSVWGRSDPLTVSTMPILQPPRNEPHRPILLRICFFFYLFFFGFVFSDFSPLLLN
jgi:hypothetical protein